MTNKKKLVIFLKQPTRVSSIDKEKSSFSLSIQTQSFWKVYFENKNLECINKTRTLESVANYSFFTWNLRKIKTNKQHNLIADCFHCLILSIEITQTLAKVIVIRIYSHKQSNQAKKKIEQLQMSFSWWRYTTLTLNYRLYMVEYTT